MSEHHAATEEWRQIARGPRVLYHVLTWPDKDDWTPEEFYDVGRMDWEDFRSQWRHYAGELSGTCLEIGCGAGRLTRQLATEFDHVVSIDVSADMIERARAASPENVEFHQVEGTRVPLPDNSVDHVFSVHVLQHLDDFGDVSAYIRDAARALRPGGTMMLHIALGTLEQGLVGRRGKLRVEWKLWRSRRALKQGKEHFAVRYRLYGLEQVQRMLEQVPLEHIEMRMFPVRSNAYQHHFFLARAPGGSQDGRAPAQAAGQ
jgi:ubiquinone/menaquinone biosynthesis C-methylase UbiE